MDVGLLNRTFEVRIAQLPFDFVVAANASVELAARGRGYRGDFFVACEQFPDVYEPLGKRGSRQRRAIPSGLFMAYSSY